MLVGASLAGGAAGTFPARGTWIEILKIFYFPIDNNTDVPRKGNVDRNDIAEGEHKDFFKDVPRKGNVDRNTAQI